MRTSSTQPHWSITNVVWRACARAGDHLGKMDPSPKKKPKRLRLRKAKKERSLQKAKKERCLWCCSAQGLAPCPPPHLESFTQPLPSFPASVTPASPPSPHSHSQSAADSCSRLFHVRFQAGNGLRMTRYGYPEVGGIQRHEERRKTEMMLGGSCKAGNKKHQGYLRLWQTLQGRYIRAGGAAGSPGHAPKRATSRRISRGPGFSARIKAANTAIA